MPQWQTTANMQSDLEGLSSGGHRLETEPLKHGRAACVRAPGVRNEGTGSLS